MPQLDRVFSTQSRKPVVVRATSETVVGDQIFAILDKDGNLLDEYKQGDAPRLSVPVYSAKSYGALGNGVADDTAGIQAAVNAGANGVVVIPPGTYLVTAPITIPSNTTILGFGKPTIKTMSGTSRDSRILVTNGGASNILIQGLILDGNTTGYTTATFNGGVIHVGTSADRVWIIDNEILNFRLWGIGLTYATTTYTTNLRVRGNYIHDGGLTTSTVGIYLPNLRGGHITENRVYNTTDDGIALISPRGYGGAGSAANDFCRDVIISNNICDTNGTTNGSGIVLTGQNVSAISNIVRNGNGTHSSDTGNYSIRARHSDVDTDEYSVYGMEIIGNQVEGFKVGGIQCYGAKAVIANNIIKGASTCYGNGLRIGHSGASPLGGNGTVRVANNIIEGAGVAGIYLGFNAAFDEVEITNNTITDCAVRGMRLEPTAGSVVLNVFNNTCRGNTSEGIRLSGDCDYVRIDGNQLIGNSTYGLVVAASGTYTMLDVGHNPAFANGTTQIPTLDTLPTEPMRLYGSGSPESAVVARVGSIYHRRDGGAATSLYVKESGTGATGWVAK